MIQRIIAGFYTVLLILPFLIPSQAIAQQVLTLDEAVAIGLENNYGIMISRNSVEQAENNLSLGNAGFLPIVDATASRTERIEDSEFQAGGESRITEGAESNNTNAAINLDWTLFDGLRMFSSYNRLGEIRDLSELQLDLNQEFLVANISFTYFNIIRISEQLNILQNNIEVTEERIEIEETKVDLGSGSEYDLLQARSDLSEDRAAYIRETNSLTEAKINLNELLGRQPSEEFDVVSEISVNRSLVKKQLYENLIEQNTELAIAKAQEDITELELREVQGERYPEISFSSGYSFNRNESGGGFFSFNETTGFSYGLTARVPIFNGFNINRRIQNAKIDQKNAEISRQQERLRIESNFESAFRAYVNAIELVDLEEENYQNAEETLDIALERFRLGSISSLEFREAQTTFLQAENRLINAKYEAKIAETELLQLSGNIDALVVQ
ncbi:TolC family protein [Rhodohalobacter sulfatireducens]|uniref:TolC family protein n=1 Tax=Rhodohalobacter sulfatireducens TaxID=2911366 RepID=A0ABS9KAI4_9BACT|nr:TolC family protein [Rhodohalobacter sulfatireducens]MCG2587841.1 TolC family protein [Rhodohalobacter sulfatireducens]